MLVVIDGPAGAGKSSTAREVARKAGIDYIDSGALYRGFTLLYVESGLEKNKFFDLIDEDILSCEFDRDESRVYIRGKNVTERLRDKEVSLHVSTVASFPEIRQKVMVLLKEAVRAGDCIAEGRDLGTAVFPDAEIKFFLTADIDERASRRHKEMIALKKESDLESVKKNLAHRDRIDSSREADPLSKADDAIEIDTTTTKFEEQVNLILARIQDFTNKQQNDSSKRADHTN